MNGRPVGVHAIDPANPLANLLPLQKVMITGHGAYEALAKRTKVWIWDELVSQGQVAQFAAGPGSGKTTLMFMLVVARANTGAPVHLLGHKVEPAPAGQFVVILEAEQDAESCSDLLFKSCARLGIDPKGALDRVIVIPRKGVRIGDPAWEDIVKLSAAGFLSDIYVDTFASCAPRTMKDANDEVSQVDAYDRIRAVIEAAPHDVRPTGWILIHPRKESSHASANKTPSVNDISGNAQRGGQPDATMALVPNRVKTRITSVTLHFTKVRGKDAGEWPGEITYTIDSKGVHIKEEAEDTAEAEKDDIDEAEAAAILTFLREKAKPVKMTPIADELFGSNKTKTKKLLACMTKDGRLIDGTKGYVPVTTPKGTVQ